MLFQAVLPSWNWVSITRIPRILCLDLLILEQSPSKNRAWKAAVLLNPRIPPPEGSVIGVLEIVQLQGECTTLVHGLDKYDGLLNLVESCIIVLCFVWNIRWWLDAQGVLLWELCRECPLQHAVLQKVLPSALFGIFRTNVWQGWHSKYHP